MLQDDTRLYTVSEILKQFYSTGIIDDDKLMKLKELVNNRSELDIDEYAIAKYLESTQEFLSKKGFDYHAFELMDDRLEVMIDCLIRYRLELWAYAFNNNHKLETDSLLPKLSELIAIHPHRIEMLPGYEEIEKYLLSKKVS